MIKFILTSTLGIILGIYIGAFIGIDKVNTATTYCFDKAKVSAKWVQTEWKTRTGENNEQK